MAVLTRTQMAGLSSGQIAGLTTTQIGGFSRVQIAALTTRQEGGLSLENIVALSAEQFSGMSAVQIRALTDGQVKALSAQIANLSRTQVAGLETRDFAAIGATLFNADQVGAMTRVQQTAYWAAGGLIGLASQ